jgi:hypothetical protein
MTMFYNDREFTDHLGEQRYSVPFSWLLSWLDGCLGVRMVANGLVELCCGHLAGWKFELLICWGGGRLDNWLLGLLDGWLVRYLAGWWDDRFVTHTNLYRKYAKLKPFVSIFQKKLKDVCDTCLLLSTCQRLIFSLLLLLHVPFHNCSQLFLSSFYSSAFFWPYCLVVRVQFLK